MNFYQLCKPNNFCLKRLRKPTCVLFHRTMSDYEKFVKYVSIKTCGTLYEKWEKENKFKSVPSGDLDFKVSYADTRNVKSSEHGSSPIVVALHGAPGSHRDFEKMTTYLHENGVQVVAPSFPDLTAYKPGVFRHSAEEKAEFVKDFLKAVSVSQVDTLIVHSSAVYPGLLLCLNSFPLVKSLVMLNPGTHTLKEMPAMKYFGLYRTTIKAIEFPILFKVLEILSPFILRTLKFPVRVSDWKDPVLSATVMVHGDIPKAKERVEKLVERCFPILYAFSDDDKVIGTSAYALANLLGAMYTDTFIYDAKGSLKQMGKEKPTLKVLCFENGSHYVFWKYPDIINVEILNFVNKL